MLRLFEARLKAQCKATMQANAETAKNTTKHTQIFIIITLTSIKIIIKIIFWYDVVNGLLHHGA